MTTLSVLTPTLNYGRFIGDALASVRSQSLPGIQHVVQDGGSEDDTQVLLAAAGVDWESARDGSQSEALNRALGRAEGEWIAWLNADEFYLPRGLERLLAAADGADVVYGDAVFVDEHGHLIRLLPQHGYSHRTLRSYGPFVSSCAMLVRRNLVEAAGWDTRLRRVMDWDLYLKLAEGGAHFRYIPFPVGAFRVHTAQVTAAPRSAFKDDYEALSRRHGLSLGGVNRLTGRFFHAWLKVKSGAYTRQLQARRLRGRDLRWFAGEQGLDGARALIDTCYSNGAH